MSVELFEHPLGAIYVYVIVLLPMLAVEGLKVLLFTPGPEYPPPFGSPLLS